MSLEFSRRIDVALNDSELRENFRGAMDFLQDKRAQAFPDEKAWQSMQQQGAQLRHEALDRLPELLETLEQNCINNGIQVHWAQDADEANELIVSIANQHKASRFVKGKSMASEEIAMNEHLTHHGIECIESDMGEYIVQLAEETPSHIIMPAIHKNKEQIARLFSDKLNEHCDPNDVDQLIGIGRNILRQKFRDADIGVSGVNFAAADTGTLCLVENEGNGRFSTTAPPVHIALMGIDKVIPSLRALPTLLRLLTRSATGQKITSYINLISSPRKALEKDGPQEVHLILLDNGRSRIGQDPDLNTTLACIRCGACMNHCPVYSRIGGHAYGSTYPGPIGQVVMPQLPTLAQGMSKHGELLNACSLNGACGEVCPVGIDLPHLIRQLRQRKAGISNSSGRKFSIEKIIWKVWRQVHLHPLIYRTSTRLAQTLKVFRFIIPKAWRRSRTNPIPAQLSLHQQLKQRKKNHDQ